MKRQWEIDELVEYWTLLPDEITMLANKTGANRLGFAVLLKFFQIEAKFPLNKHDIPKEAIAYVAKQVGVPPEQYCIMNGLGVPSFVTVPKSVNF